MKTLSILLTASLCVPLFVTAQTMTASASSTNPPDEYVQTSIPQQGY